MQYEHYGNCQITAFFWIFFWSGHACFFFPSKKQSNFNVGVRQRESKTTGKFNSILINREQVQFTFVYFCCDWLCFNGLFVHNFLKHMEWNKCGHILFIRHKTPFEVLFDLYAFPHCSRFFSIFFCRCSLSASRSNSQHFNEHVLVIQLYQLSDQKWTNTSDLL